MPRGALDLALFGLPLFVQLLDPELTRCILQHPLNPELGIGQPLSRGPKLRDPFLEQEQRLIQIGIVGFELADDVFETLEIRGEGAGNPGSRGARHAGKLSAIGYEPSARDGTSPSPTRSVNGVPGGSWARRRATIPSPRRAML